MNAKNKTNSITKINASKIRSAKITKVLINIPMPIENPTKPFLYSFFQGLKYVFIKRDRETSLRNDLFKDPKKTINPLGASRNQNFKKTNGSDK
ncbi:hypothetical protein M1146_02235 [Patescibacteria group bacterium]|nr:hypothetical protein [Patescibacteria group bacterium]